MQKTKVVTPPYNMIRVAGMPYTGLAQMRAPQTMQALRSITSHGQWLAEQTGSLVETIEQAVPTLGSDDVRNKLIAYKRHLFNGKFPKQQAPFFQGHLPDALLKRMGEWEARYLAVRELEEQAAALYEEELAQCRERLQGFVQQEEFLNGVALTSRDMYAKVLTYINTPIGEQNARLRRVEYSLMTFVSRVAAKTSPFSTFTSVGLFREKAGQGETSLTMPTLQMDSKVRLNHANILRIPDALAKQPAIRPLLSYRLNPTMKITGEKVSLICRYDHPKTRSKVFRTLERPISIDYNAPIHLVVSQFQHPDQILPYEELLDRLTAASKNTREQLGAFVGRLIEMQIVEPHIPLYEQTPDLIGDVIAWMSGLEAEIAQQTVEGLQQAQELLRVYRRSSATKRSALQLELRGVFAKMYDRLGIQEYDRALSLLIYEDGVLPGFGDLQGTAWEEMYADLSAFQALAPLFDDKFRIQSVYAHEFCKLYGEDGVCENTYDFLNQMIPCFTAFFEAMTPGDMLSIRNIRNDIEPVRRLNELNREFGELIAERMHTDPDEVVLHREELQRLAARVPERVQSRMLSHDFFVQWGKRGGEDLLVVNQVYHGYGAFFSRFLEHYDAAAVEEFRAYLDSLFQGQEGVVAELSNAYGFNGSLHPKLTPYELQMPMLDTSRQSAGDDVIDWRDLQLVYDQETDRVVLHHGEHGPVSVLSLGLLVPLLMPFISNFLWNMFNNASIPNKFYQFCEADFTDEEFAAVRVYPRVRLGRVVLSRKQWWIPQQHLPQKGAKEEEFDFFYRLHRWRMEQGLPARCFVRFQPTTPAEKERLFGGISPTDENSFDFTNMKPQYIDFDNPLLVRLLGKMILDSACGMSVEEMLPEEEALPLEGDGERYVSEFLLELTQTVTTKEEVLADEAVYRAVR